MSKHQKTVYSLSECPHPDVCPLNRVGVGKAVRIKRLSASPEMAERLREMGVYEDQEVKLLIKGNNVICKVCNARLGLSKELAESIIVEPLTPPITPAS